MGLIKAITSSVSSGVGDQFKVFVSCPTIAQNVLIQKGTVNHGDGSKHYSEEVIPNGSKIVVPQGMAMMVIDNGAIKEFTAEPGDYTYDTSTEPSVFTGGLGRGILDTIKNIGNRITFGGQTAKDQRVYYINLLKIPDNKFGSPQPRKITDDKYGMLEVTFNGAYVFQVVDPAILVTSVIGANPKDTITYDEVIGGQLKMKFVEQLTRAITEVMRKHRIPFGDIGMYGTDISNEMNTILDESWRKEYGLEIVDVAINDLNLTDASMERVNKIDDATIFSNPALQSGLMASASADAMKAAAGNESGAMMGFMGMGMAQAQGANMIGAVNQNYTGVQPSQPTPTPAPEPGTLFGGVTVAHPDVTVQEPVPTEVHEEQAQTFCPDCGTLKVGKFCTNCGKSLE